MSVVLRSEFNCLHGALLLGSYSERFPKCICEVVDRVSIHHRAEETLGKKLMEEFLGIARERADAERREGRRILPDALYGTCVPCDIFLEVLFEGFSEGKFVIRDD